MTDECIDINLEFDVKHRCKACGDEYNSKKKAVNCYHSHTGQLAEMIDRIVSDDSNH